MLFEIVFFFVSLSNLLRMKDFFPSPLLILFLLYANNSSFILGLPVTTFKKCTFELQTLSNHTEIYPPFSHSLAFDLTFKTLNHSLLWRILFSHSLCFEDLATQLLKINSNSHLLVSKT